MTANYITVTEFKNTAELAGVSFADYDATMAIGAASRGVDQYTGRRFDSDVTGSTIVRYYTPAEPGYLYIDDLVSVATVATDLTGNGTFSTVWTLNVDYVLDPLNAAADGWPYEQIRVHPASAQRFPAWPRSVAVTGQWGWPTAIPDNVREATTILSVRLLKRAREAPLGVASFGMEGAALHISRTDPDVCFLLDNWIRGGKVLAA
jgi:hypothetical protein